MTCETKSQWYSWPVAIILVALVFLTTASKVFSEEENIPQIVVSVGDALVNPGQHNVPITVSLSNFVDTVAGFNLWIRCTSPDIILFQTDIDTVIDTTYWECLQIVGEDCVDSAITSAEGNWDFFYVDTNEVSPGFIQTTGTLTANWDVMQAYSLGDGHDLNVAGYADYPGGEVKTGIGPQVGGVLFRMLADVYNIPDTATNRSVELQIEYHALNHFNLARPNGTSIGIAYRQILDTNYWVCVQWAGDSCVQYERTQGPPYDLMEINPDSVPYVDTTVVILNDGTIDVAQPPQYTCGNIDGVEPATINIVDLTYLIQYLFANGPEPIPLEAGDINCDSGSGSGDGLVNIIDLTAMVAYLFSAGTAPCAACP